MLKLLYIVNLLVLGIIFPAMVLDISPNKVGVVLSLISELASVVIILDKRIGKV